MIATRSPSTESNARHTSPCPPAPRIVSRVQRSGRENLAGCLSPDEVTVLVSGRCSDIDTASVRQRGIGENASHRVVALPVGQILKVRPSTETGLRPNLRALSLNLFLPSERPLLKILHLFPNPFGGALGIDDPVGDTEFPALGPQGIELTMDFLAEKIQGLADGAARIEPL